MRIAHDQLKQLVQNLFAVGGCRPPEDERIAHYLVEANLVGHDSHGVIRVPAYLDWLQDGRVLPNRQLQVVFDSEALAVVDGQFGFGQVLGEQAMRLGIAKATRHGVAVVALRNSGHLGRIGDWALQAARAGLLSLHFVNTSGAGLLVAPHGGTERRLSANPIAAGIPVRGGPPAVVDLSTCTIAEGKIRVALNRGVPVPEGCLIDAGGRPTTDPRVFYGPPPGAILPMAGHKGYALGLLVEVLAGALTGGSCSHPAQTRVANNMLTILLAPGSFQSEAAFFAEVERYFAFVKSSAKAAPDGEILLPGEPEARTRALRLRDGIDLEDATWGQIAQKCRALGVEYPGGSSPPAAGGLSRGEGS